MSPSFDRKWPIGKLNHKEVKSETKVENETYSKSFNCRYFKNFECGTNGDDSFTARERERERESESVNLDGSQRF